MRFESALVFHTFLVSWFCAALVSSAAEDDTSSHRHLHQSLDGSGSSRGSNSDHTKLVKGIDGDPGIYPGSPGEYKTGWRVLPQVPGANVDTINVGSGGATLTHYITSDYDAQQIKRAVIIIHGENRVGWNEMIYGQNALQRAVQGGQVRSDEVVLLTPEFFNDVDHGAYPADPLTNASTTSTMIWSDKLNNWGDGSPSLYPSGSTVGAFEALDAILAFFDNKAQFPNLNTVVVGGFSMGAQLVQRYSMFRTDLTQDSRTKYWVSSPASFLYLNDTRPDSTKHCDDFNEYKYGLEGELPPYVAEGADSQELTQDAIGPRYVSRYLNFLVGLNDHIAGDEGCEANAQGRNHVVKLNNWVERVLPYLPGTSLGKRPINTTVDYVANVAHEDFRIIPSDPGVQRLFLDDYNGPGTSASAPPSNGDVSTQPSKANLTDTDGDGGQKKNGGVALFTGSYGYLYSLPLFLNLLLRLM